MKHHRNLVALSHSFSLPVCQPTHPLAAKNLNNFYYVARYEFLMSPMPQCFVGFPLRLPSPLSTVTASADVAEGVWPVILH